MKIILRKLDYNGKIIYGYNVACFGCDYESFVLCSLLVSDKDSVSAYVDTITQRNKYASDFIFSEEDGQLKNILREDVENYIGQKAVFLYVNRQIYKDIRNPVLEQIGEDYVFRCDNQPIKEIQNTYEKIETKCDCKTYNIFNIPEENFNETWIINGKFSGHPVFLKNQYPHKTISFYRKFADIEGKYNNFLIHEGEYFAFIIS